MAVTSYYTVEGKIVAEASGGNRLDYLTDALGSVTAKTDDSFSVVSTARYKPYGDLLTGSSYKFGWVGSLGYRDAVGGSYVRARHYLSVNSAWTSVDFLWPRQPSYSYVSSNPTVWSDYTGLSPVLTRTRYRDKDRPYIDKEPICGNYAVSWKFGVSDGSQNLNGWLVQKIISSRRQAACMEPLTEIGCGEFFEVWMVFKGEVYSPGKGFGGLQPPWSNLPADDTWSDERGGNCQFGFEQTLGFLTFVEDGTVDPFAKDVDLKWLGKNKFLRDQPCNTKGFTSKTFEAKDWSAPGLFGDDWGCCKKTVTRGCDEEICEKCKTPGKCQKDFWVVYP